MGFPISTIAVDSGLSWEQNLNAALTVIDQHNHSPGFGQQIQPNGLNISSDLSFQSNNATDLRAARFTPQLSPIPNSGSDVGELYVSGNELYYNDVTGGNQVQITASGTVNATSSGISSGTASASFSANVLLVKSSSTSYANIAMQSAVLSNSGNLTNQLTLQAPTLSTSYSITLPSIPGATSFVTLDTSGNLSGSIPISGGLTTSNLSASAGIVGTQLSSSANILGSQLSATAGITPKQLDSLTGGSYIGFGSSSPINATFTGTTGSSIDGITGLSFSTTRPTFVNFNTFGMGSPSLQTNGTVTIVNNGGTPGSVTFTFFTAISAVLYEVTLNCPASSTVTYPASVLNMVYFIGFSGSNIFYKITNFSNTTSIHLDNVCLTAFQV